MAKTYCVRCGRGADECECASPKPNAWEREVVGHVATRCDGMNRVGWNGLGWKPCKRRPRKNDRFCGKHREAADWIALLFTEGGNGIRDAVLRLLPYAGRTRNQRRKN